MIKIACYCPEIALNLGNIIRTAACFGVPVSVIEPCGFPFSIKALRRSAMDYADNAEIFHYQDFDEYCAKTTGRKILLTTKTSLSYTHFSFQSGDNLLFGQESAGVPDSVSQACEAHLTIPMPGVGRSLNVSTSAGIVMSEALRQLGKI